MGEDWLLNLLKKNDICCFIFEIIKMSFNVRLMNTPNGAWEKAKSILDEDSL